MHSIRLKAKQGFKSNFVPKLKQYLKECIYKECMYMCICLCAHTWEKYEHLCLLICTNLIVSAFICFGYVISIFIINQSKVWCARFSRI